MANDGRLLLGSNNNNSLVGNLQGTAYSLKTDIDTKDVEIAIITIYDIQL